MQFSLPALIVFLFPLAYSPGPGNVYFAALGSRFGYRASLPANLGYHAATLLVSLVVGLGFSEAMQATPWLMSAIQFIGAGYVIWLGGTMIRASSITNGEEQPVASWYSGALLLVLNPKAWVIMALLFSQFLTESTASLVNVAVISAIFTVNNFIAFSVWALAGERLTAAFRSPRTAHRLNILLGLVLILVGVWMIVG